jgi:hypothetical protein
MRTFPPNTVIVEVDPLQNADDVEQHGPTFYWGRGFILGALHSAATVASSLAPCTPLPPWRTCSSTAGTPFPSRPAETTSARLGRRDLARF